MLIWIQSPCFLDLNQFYVYSIVTGKHDVFDNVVYPPEESHQRSRLETFKKFLGFGRSEKGDFVIPEHSVMQVRCLEIYLRCFRSAFLDLSFSSDMEVGSVASHISEIFRQVHSPVIVLANDVYKRTRTETEVSKVKI